MKADSTKTITNPVKAIRAFCLECVGGSSYEVKDCTAKDCALYPFRFGKNPYRTKRELTEEQKTAAVERFAIARQKKKIAESQKEGD